MNDAILKKLEQRLDRRSFLRGSGLAAAAIVALTAASPLMAFEQTQDKPQDDKKKADPEKSGTRDAPQQKDDEKKDQGTSSSEDSTTETKLDADGREYRVCPECGSNMYRQGRTWTCENCGYSYIE